MNQTHHITEYHRIKRSLGYLLIVPAMIFMLYAGVMAYMSVQQYAKNIKALLSQSDLRAEHELAAADTVYQKLLDEESFLSARSAMVWGDSTGLSIDLKNMLVNLELQGVQLHKVKISAAKTDRAIAKADNFYWIKTLAYPLAIDSSVSSIARQTFVEKQAPKDTTDVQASAVRPDTAVSQPVFFSFFLSNGLTLTIVQENSKNAMAYKKFAFQRKLDTMRGFLFSVLRFEIPVYRPGILIEIPARDARIIYKALPKRAMTALRIA
jgi:hypothetical protein